MKVKWRSINGYEGIYEVSDNGEVRSINRKRMTKRGFCESRKEHILKPCIKRTGYAHVHLCKNNRIKYLLISRLVGDHFLERKNTSCNQINHKNGIKLDNRASNLEWVTPRENQDHALKTGLMKPKNKPILCIETGEKYISISEAARKIKGSAYGICHSMKRIHRHRGLTFRFYNKSVPSL